MKRLSLAQVTAVISNLVLSTAGSAKQGLITDVHLSAPVIDTSYVSAELVGWTTTGRCITIINALPELGTNLIYQPEINIYLETVEFVQPCVEAQAISRTVYLGHLQPNAYVINIYENDQLTKSKTVTVPDDVLLRHVDFDSRNQWGNIFQFEPLRT